MVDSENDALAAAVKMLTSRKSRMSHPDGKTHNARRWYPSDEEWQSCCNAVRSPSLAFPWSYMTHCRTAQHVANLHNVDVSDLRKAERDAQPKGRLGGDNHYKAVALLEDGRYVSIFDGTTTYEIGKTLVERVGKNHGGGFYVYATPEAALSAKVPTRSVLIDAPRVILQIRAAGQYTRYPCNCGCNDFAQGYDGPHSHPTKYSFSRVTPLRVVPQSIENTMEVTA